MAATNQRPLAVLSRQAAARILARQRLAMKGEGAFWRIDAGAMDVLSVRFNSIDFQPSPRLDRFALDDWFALDREKNRWTLTVGDLTFDIRRHNKKIAMRLVASNSKRDHISEFKDMRR